METKAPQAGDLFIIRYRKSGRVNGRLVLPIELYSPEECEAHVEDIRREGYSIVSAELEAA